MKQFLKRLMLGVVTLAMFCCVTPLAFADSPNYYTIYLERQGGTSGKGPIGSKGPGETQLETDRRLINKKIDKIRADLEEVRRVRAPSVFLELAFHDNTSDAVWIQNNLDAVARNLALSLTEYFGIPFFSTRQDRPAVVDVSWGVLNIRDRPDTDGTILAQAPDGARLTVFNQFDGWYLVEYDGVTGYASGDFVTLA